MVARTRLNIALYAHYLFFLGGGGGELTTFIDANCVLQKFQNECLLYTFMYILVSVCGLEEQNWQKNLNNTISATSTLDSKSFFKWTEPFATSSHS